VKERIIELLRDNPDYTKQDLMEVLEKASGTIKEHIRHLQKEGRLERIGGRKEGHWKVSEESVKGDPPSQCLRRDKRVKGELKNGMASPVECLRR